jgi:hypothetical protein
MENSEIKNEAVEVPAKRPRGRPKVEKKEGEEKRKYPNRDTLLTKKITAIVRAELEAQKI